ncbi:beta-galactosidase [Salipaludibacillus sp. HK11]|uniref:glycoside hydrolase family 35 protein n=1 Tax=Salipaludibacillus sp. HK11 TaxID=3394320 RepID=UPI0039FC9280
MLETRGNEFYLDDKPFRILSGSIHYFRVVPELWEDRLLKLKECGFNTVETYLPWNVHEPKKGMFNFTGLADVEAFVRLAEKLGLYVILRPSPYICAEWEFGGLPAWLLKDKNMRLRCSDPAYLKQVEEYFDVLLPKLAPLQRTQGGPVIAMQIENEYGAYGDDKSYLRAIKEMYEKHKLDVLLFTSDGPDMIEAGSLPDVLTTLNFGSRVDEAEEHLERLKPGSPKFCAEFWIGWFDSWGNPHHVRGEDDTGEIFGELLDKGWSVNFYMFHGGTNFGFMNGANHYETYDPTITSYDYDALLTEDGERTAKFYEVQKILYAFQKLDVPAKQESKRVRTEEMTVKLTEKVSLFAALDTVATLTKAPAPLSFEELDQNYGYVLYRTQISGSGEKIIDLTPVQDRALIYINGEFQTTYDLNEDKKERTFFFPDEVNTLELLVENMGRVNYGKHLQDSKGLVKNLWINNRYHFDWEMYSVAFEDVSMTLPEAGESRYPFLLKGEVTISEPQDKFVSLTGFTKGNVWINGFHLGRYWNIGPQQTLYLPAPLLKKGENAVLVLELEHTNTTNIQLLNKAVLG